MAGAGCLLTLRKVPKFSTWHYVGLAILLLGLLSSLSRGPWLGFALFASLSLAAQPRTAVKLLVWAIPFLAGAVHFSPGGFSRFVNLLPFVGSSDPGSEIYRSQLFTNAMIVIERYPLFGSLTFLQEPEMLRMIQGQGIIDVVNSYLQIALEFGLVGLFLFLTFFVALAASLFVQAAKSKVEPSPLNHAGLLAILLAVLVTIATTSSVSVIPHIYWAFAGICAALPRLRKDIDQEPPVRAQSQMRVLNPFG